MFRGGRPNPYGTGITANLEKRKNYNEGSLDPARTAFAKQVGQNHLKVRFGDGLGTQIDAIAFDTFDSPLGQAISNHDGRRFHLVGRLELNEWQGRRSVQMRLEDAAPATTN